MSYSISMNHQRRSSRGGGKPCRFGDTCRNSNCRFEHSVQPIMTTSSSNNNSRDTRRSRGPCRFGAGCTRPDCWFDHPLKQERPAANAPMTYSFEIQGPAAVDAPKAATTTSSQNITNESIQSSKAYRFCSSQECRERQELGQVSVFEATAETANLPQNQRCLDPTLAVAKYRRSAAGTTHTSQQSKESLELLLQHLVTIAATRRPTPQHSPVDDWQGPWTEFLVDRLRACQADATRLFGQASGSILPSTWHTIMARLLIWIRYWMPWKQADKFLEQTLAAMLSTAMDHYWSTCQVERGMKKGDTNMDDEMLCYAALSRLSQHCSGSSPAASSSLGERSVSSTTLGAHIILDYSKHVTDCPARHLSFVSRGTQIDNRMDARRILWHYSEDNRKATYFVEMLFGAGFGSRSVSTVPTIQCQFWQKRGCVRS